MACIWLRRSNHHQSMCHEPWYLVFFSAVSWRSAWSFAVLFIFDGLAVQLPELNILFAPDSAYPAEYAVYSEAIPDFIGIFPLAIPTIAGAITMAVIGLRYVSVCGPSGFVAVASKTTWAFARDRRHSFLAAYRQRYASQKHSYLIVHF